MKAAIPLYPYQTAYFLDRARFKAGMFARQTGKTFTSCAEIVDDCFESILKGGKNRWVILSRGERQAQEAMREGIIPHAKAYNLALEYLDYDYKAESGSTYRAQEVVLPNGTRITALPANPDTARGFSANSLLDEFAFHKDSLGIWRSITPVISRGYKMRVISTPNGKGNKFYEIMTGKNDGWSRHVVDIYKAVKEGLPFNIDEFRRAMGDEDGWAQEFELKWLDEASAWLAYDLIFAVEDAQAGKPHLYEGNACYVGRDIGRRNDLHVIWVWEKVGDVIWCREIIAQKRATFREQAAAFDDVMKRYRVARACIDQTGMGEAIVEEAQHKYGSTVEGVLFNTGSKLIMANAGKDAFEDKKVRIPEGDMALRADLHKLRKISSPAGAPRFVAERDDDHADRTWAAFLGIHAAAGGGYAYGYEPVRGNAGDDDDYKETGSYIPFLRGNI